MLPRLVGVLQSTETPAAYAAADRYIEDEIERVVRKPGPIIVGPFLSEVGFELLYWIPLLRWIKEKWQMDPERLTVVSRGGTALWYDGLNGRYLDVRLHQSRTFCGEERRALGERAAAEAIRAA